jgi:hypothetical protein
MSKIQKADTCYRCGKPIVVVKVTKEYVNKSLVVTTESICSDPLCQKKSEETQKKEKARREEVILNKNYFGRNKAADSKD